MDRSGNNAGWIIAAIVVAMCVTVSLVAEFSMPSKEEHYSRNEGITIDLPSKESEVEADWPVSDNKKNTTHPNGPKANAHQFSSEDHKSNIKYVSPDGKIEVVYDAQGEIVTDPRDIGTYNYSPFDNKHPISSGIGHYLKDVRPWIRWGNSPEDTTTPWQRMWALLEVY